MNYDLAVAYRIYPGVSKTPAVHPKDKFKLAEFCLKSFKRSLGGLRVKCHAVLDGCPDEYCRLFEESFGGDLEILRMNKAGNPATFARQIEILLAQNESEYVYLAEDDYFYLDGGFEKMHGFFAGNKDAHFITPYDHPDYYHMAIHDRPEKIAFSRGMHFRTAASTCLTFMTSKTVLRETAPVFEGFSRGLFDCTLWLALTNGNNSLARYLVNGRMTGFERTLVSEAVKKFPMRVLTNKRYNLWVPIPGVGTHIEHNLLGPGVDWQAEFARHLR